MSESAVEKLLREMKLNGDIVDFSKTDPEKDRVLGIDFEIVISSKFKIPIQVKSSLFGMKEYWKKHSDIPVIVVDLNNLDLTRRRILSLIAFYPDWLRRGRFGGNLCCSFCLIDGNDSDFARRLFTKSNAPKKAHWKFRGNHPRYRSR